MVWFFSAITAFFLLAVATVTDKFMLEKTPIEPLSFAFAISVAGGLICIGLYLPLAFIEKKIFFPTGFPLIAISINGVSQFFGLLFMFETVKRSEVSKANPVIVALQPVFCLFLAIILPVVLPFISQNAPGLKMLSTSKLAGVVMVITGGFFLARTGERDVKFDISTWAFAILSGFLLALSSVFANISYSVFETTWTTPESSIVVKDATFLKAFVWGRWITLIAGLLFIIFTNNWKVFKPENKRSKPVVKTGLTISLFIFGQACGGVAIILQQYALKVGNAIIVTALNGVQFFFVLIIMFLLTKFFPKILKENMSKPILIRKIIWSIILCCGIALTVSSDNILLNLYKNITKLLNFI